MKKLFEIISPEKIAADTCNLIGELTGEGFSYAIKSIEKNQFIGAGVFEFDKADHQVEFFIALQIFLHQHEVLSGDFNKVRIVYSLPESVLIPFPLYNSKQNKEVLNLLHGDLKDDAMIFTEILNAHDLYNAYRLPAELHKTIDSQYPNFKGVHHYTLLLQQKPLETDQLSVVFYNSKMVVCLFKNGQFKLINTFDFRVAEDVSYILLNICRQFETGDIKVELSGLIEENSSLYRDIYKYFGNISFSKLPGDFDYTEEILNYPPQYFSHLFAFAHANN